MTHAYSYSRGLLHCWIVLLGCSSFNFAQIASRIDFGIRALGIHIHACVEKFASLLYIYFYHFIDTLALIR